MIFTTIELENFRSYPKASFEFSPETTLIVGPNTSGKTNLLEAVFLLGLGQTFRPGLGREIILWGEDLARVKGTVGDSQTDLELILTRGEILGKPAPLKKLLVNGVSRRLFNFVGHLQVVMFGPQDLQLVTDSPSSRRNHLNFVLEQVDKEYRKRLQVYHKALSQRNRLLKLIREGKRTRIELSYWDNLLVEHGNFLTKKRRDFFGFINQLPRDLGEFVFDYQSSEINFEGLEKYQDQEVAAGMTLTGPHRDDFQFRLRFGQKHGQAVEYGLAISGSRGEQRRAVLTLKLAELEFMTHRSPNNDRPVLLLDDIFSELDGENRREILRVVPRQQTMIATTDMHLVEKSFLDKIKIIEL